MKTVRTSIKRFSHALLNYKCILKKRVCLPTGVSRGVEFELGEISSHKIDLNGGKLEDQNVKMLRTVLAIMKGVRKAQEAEVVMNINELNGTDLLLLVPSPGR